jgi:hypothetical protein
MNAETSKRGHYFNGFRNCKFSVLGNYGDDTVISWSDMLTCHFEDYVIISSRCQRKIFGGGVL